MPTEVSWYIDKRVILEVMSGILTRQDLIENRKQVDAFGVLGSPPIYMITDVSRVQKFPLDFRAMRDSYGGHSTWNVAWVVLVGTNPLLPAFISGLAPLLRLKVRMVRTREDAFRFLEQVDPALKPLLDAKP